MTNRLAAIILLAASASASSASTTSVIDQTAPYVYPQNQAKTPDEMQFMPDGRSYLAIIDDGRKIVQYDTASGEPIATVFDASHTRTASIDATEGMIISPDGSKLLLWTDSKPIYRRSSDAKYYVFEISRNILKPLSDKTERQQIPQFSPDGRMVAFVAHNDIIVKKLDYDNEVAVTSDGSTNAIRNGLPDWTYEEEFQLTSAITWAPDNSMLCYIKYDESQVPLYSFPLYEGACDPKPQYALYPGSMTYKYPVAGKPNSKVSVHSYNIETRATKRVALPDNIEYIPRIDYAYSPERLMVVALNREQNKMDIYAANPKSTVANLILTETSKTWIDPASYEDIAWEADGFVMQSPRSGYNHLYRYTYAGALVKQLTTGDWNVTAYYGTDPAGVYYFQSTFAGPLDRLVQTVDQRGKLTTISAPKGTSSASFSPLKNYYTLCYSDATTPPVYTLRNAKHKALRTLEANDSLKAIAPTLPQREFFEMQSDGVTLNGYMIKPVNALPGRRYPVIMWQYSGPGSQEVLNRWHLDWEVAAARLGIGVICVDGRGTGGRDRAFTDIVYRQLGHFETIDQLAAARHAATLDWVDASRIGIAGWSYGGFESLMAASADAAPYAAAVAIAPVTDWRYYDTVYAERYMLTPQANPDGYATSAPVSRAASLNCPLLLMHGTADDNVHLANTLEMSARLVNERKAPDMLLFTNQNHSIRGCDTRAVVYGKMIDWFINHLK